MKMKKIILVLIALLQANLLCLEAEEIDSLLLKEYQSSHSIIMKIIEEENLSDSLQGCPFYVIHFHHYFWTIVVEKRYETLLYYRNTDQASYKSLHFSKEKGKLNRIYSLLDLNMGDNIRWHRNDYIPFYLYFAIFDMNHKAIFEWNSSTKSTRYERKIHKTIRENLSFLFKNTDIFEF